MKTRIYTDEELKTLKENTFVLGVNYKRIINYDPVFKLWCIMIRLKFPELTASEIFSLGGFDTSILNRDLPRKRINEWLYKYKKYGSNYFVGNSPYYSIKTKKLETYPDEFRNKLLKSILENLKELNCE